MGNGALQLRFGRRLKRADEEAAMYPSYYIKNVQLNDDHIELAMKSWKLVMDAYPSQRFIDAKQVEGFEHPTCLTWFYEKFYNRFFELCPEATKYFKDVSIVKQGRLIAAVISGCLRDVRKPEMLKQHLVAMVKSHHPKGVKVELYGFMGLALIETLEYILGTEIFDEKTKIAWVHLYSVLLSNIVPAMYDLDHGIVPAEVDKSTSSVAKSTQKKCPF